MNHAQQPQHIITPTQLCAGILNFANTGRIKAARAVNTKDVVTGLVALVNTKVPKKTAQDPRPPQVTMSQWKKTSKI